MHKLNVLILGSTPFLNTLNELKSYLKFNPLVGVLSVNHDAILFNYDALKDSVQKDLIDNSNALKIYAIKKRDKINNFDLNLELPATLKEINAAVENLTAKNKFNKNSSIEIKGYLLNKNEKKLFRSHEFIILTEKEIHLLELFLNNMKPISKDKILSSVWNYSADTDTHTVETHIYRLRKKISDKFKDEKFIINNKDGYCL